MARIPGAPVLSRERVLLAGLGVLALLLGFLQRPRLTYLDTRIELTEDPVRFLGDAHSMWSATTDLGHVQSGQFVGYLFPQGPWFAAVDLAGLPQWIGERLWLALWLWIAAWGAVTLLRTLHRPQVAWPHAVGGLLFMANPYVVVQANRASASLLAYAVLPWLLIAAHRGLRRPRGWRWPAVIALAVAASSGGTNAATVFWVALAPVLLVLYEVVVLRGSRAAAWSLAWRTGLLTAAASAWWVGPVLLAGGIAPNFLSFTEQPEAIWSATTMSEALRLMGYWTSYFQGGFDEVEPAARAVLPYLENPAVIVATFLLPLWACSAFLLARRWRYLPFFGLVLVVGLVAMTAGYPTTRPAGQALLDAYYAFSPLQVLRTTYKAGPLVAIALACLAAAATHEALAWRARRLAPGRPLALRLAPLALVPVVVMIALPLFTGRLIDRPYAYGEVPSAWRTALDDADRASAPGRRVMVLPGQLFGAFAWGRTFTPLAPALTGRPVLQRAVSRYADPRAVQLQDAVDDAIQQRRLVSGQLDPLLRLMGVDQVLVATDGRPGQSGEAPPAAIAAALASQRSFQQPVATFGPARRFMPRRGEPGPAVALPHLRRYAVAAGAPGMVRLVPVAATTIVDGDAEALVALAAQGRLRPDGALVYAPDISSARLDEAVAAGAELVFTDTNRRRTISGSEIADNRGPTVAAGDVLPRDRPSYDPFPEAGPAAQTVATLDGIADVRTVGAPNADAKVAERPFVALDRRLDTTWQPAPGAFESCGCLEIVFERPVRLSRIDVHPSAFQAGATLPLGVQFDGGKERPMLVVPAAWNTLRFRERVVRRLRLRPVTTFGAFGLNEVQLPGPPAQEALRLPTTLAAATRTRDLRRNAVSVELERTTSDDPWRRGDADDPELGLLRDVTLPAARRFRLSGWATTTSDATDLALDRLTRLDPSWRYASSGRFRGVPGLRASSAFDGRRETVWADQYGDARNPWLSWSGPAAVELRRLRLVRGPREYAFPRLVTVAAAGRTFADLPVERDGTVTLPAAVRAREARIEVEEVAAPPSLARQVAAVAVAEVEVPGLRPATPRRRGAIASGCDALEIRAAGATARARVTGDAAALDRGDPLSIEGCGTLALPAGTTRVAAPAGTLVQADRLSLFSGAPDGAAPPPGTAPRAGDVVAVRGAGDGTPQEATLDVGAPAWLVLAQGWNRAWRASCGGKDLGEPTPIAGYANGWRVGAGCRDVKFSFGPQRAADVMYAISALAAIPVLLLAVVLPLLRRRRRPEADEALDAFGAWPGDPVWRPARGQGVALVAATFVLGALLLTVAVGAALAGLAAVLLWLGVTSRRLVAVALAAIVVVVVLYLAGPSGTFALLSIARAPTNLPAHWVAVVAVVAIGAAAIRDSARLRRRIDS